MRWIDVAHHQGTINFAAVAESGIAGVIVKATEGRDYIDPRWSTNWIGLCGQSTTLGRGAYHMARFNTDHGDPLDAVLEAQHFARVLTSSGYDDAIVPWVDVERYGLTELDGYNVRWLAQFIETFERVFGRTPGIYAGRNTWADRLANSPLFAHVPLWAVDLKAEPGEAQPFGGHARVTLHQHSFEGRVPGIAVEVDLDELCGGPELFEALRFSPVIVPRVFERPHLDLRYIPATPARDDVAMLQGALLGRGLGPAGLVGADGRPDGKAGPRTRETLVRFRAGYGLDPVPVCDGATWSALAQLRG